MVAAVRTPPEKRDAVLKDFRAGKVTSPSALAKAHGVSRSSVYRILQAEKHRVELETAKAKPEAKQEDTDAQSQDDDGGSVQSEVSNSFYYRSTRFADDLGLAEVGARPSAVEGPQEAPEEVEAKLDAMMGHIVAQGGGRPSGLGEAPPPPSRIFQDILMEPPAGLRVFPKAAAPPPPMEPYVDRADVTQRIIFNVEHFGALLKPIVGPDPQAFLGSLTSRSDRELAGLLKALERARSVGNIASGFKQTFFVVAQATEMGTRMIGMKADGFTERLRQQDEEITMIMKEIAMDQWERVKAMDRPEMRLGMLFCMTLAQTDAQNRLREQVERFKGSALKPGVAEAHADL